MSVAVWDPLPVAVAGKESVLNLCCLWNDYPSSMPVLHRIIILIISTTVETRTVNCELCVNVSMLSAGDSGNAVVKDALEV